MQLYEELVKNEEDSLKFQGQNSVGGGQALVQKQGQQSVGGGRGSFCCLGTLSSPSRNKTLPHG